MLISGNMSNRVPPHPTSAVNPDAEPPDTETLRAAAAHYLLQGGDQEAAALLLSLNLEVSYLSTTSHKTVYLVVVGPREVYDRFGIATTDGLATKVSLAMHAVGKSLGWYISLSSRLAIPELTSDDQQALIDLALGRHIHNQAAGVPLQKVVLWENLRFRSQTEAKIAQALDRAGAAFWPNCRARVGEGKRRHNLEADFLVLWDGRYGILEIDGEPWHPPERRAAEQVRDRVWQRHGVKLVQHYDSKRAYSQPDGVVQDFLKLLEKF